VLVTQAGDPVDHVLGAREAFVSRPRGLVVVWALSGTDVAASSAQEADPCPAPRRSAGRARGAARTFGRTTA
jgi:1,2-phenylacetyl-CoA epoxidase PaaB subunit